MSHTLTQPEEIDHVLKHLSEYGIAEDILFYFALDGADTERKLAAYTQSEANQEAGFA